MRKLILLLLLLLVGCSSTPTEIDFEQYNISTQRYELINETWDKNYSINNDYQGEICFTSGLVDLPFVQGKNDYYIRRDWETTNYSPYGSIYMDEDCDLNSQNITIYGHYVYSSYDDSLSRMFTPLAKLTDKDNYAENSIIELDLKDETRVYKITHVYEINLTEIDGEYYVDESMQYYRPKFDKDYFNNYIAQVDKLAFYDTGEELTEKDKMLTLQTCVENHEDKRLIVLAKEVDVVKRR